MTETLQTLTLAQARRIALAAQGFGEARPGALASQRHITRVIDAQECAPARPFAVAR